MGEVLQTFDPKGNLGGITSPVDDWLRDKMGLPPRDSGITPGELFDGFENILPDFKPASSAGTDDGGRAVSLDAYLDDFGPQREQWEGGRHRAGLGAGPQSGEGYSKFAPPFGATVGNDTSLPKTVGLLISALSSLPSQWQGDRVVREQRPEERGGATMGTGASAITNADRLEKALGAMPSGYQQDRSLTLDAGTIGQLLQPSRGVQEVRVTSKEPPNVTVHAPVTITNISSPQEAVDAAASQLGQRIKAAYEAADTD